MNCYPIFGINYSQRFHRNIPKFILLKPIIEQFAYKVAQEKFNEPFYFVLYDVTTLYFETFIADELKVQGFSKDNKSLQPQIVIGLLVTQSGFPLKCEAFSENTFEGKTMQPIVEQFLCRNSQTKPIILLLQMRQCWMKIDWQNSDKRKYLILFELAWLM